MSEEIWKINNRVETAPTGFKTLIQWLDRELSVEQTLDSILEAGCGNAVFTPHLARRAAHLRSCDHSSAQIAANCKALPDVSFFVQDLSNPIASESKSFDALWCCNTLDRLLTPAFAINEFHRVLKPGGRLLIAVPYHGFFKNLMIALFKWNTTFTPDSPHIRFFTVKTLTRLVKQVGFRDIKTKTCGFAYILLSAKK